MAIVQPISTDKLNDPSHSKLHRVIASDSGAADESLVVDASGNVNIKTGKQYQVNSVNIIEDSVTDGHTTIAPSGNAVFDALALKAKDSEVVKYNTLKRNGDVFVAQGNENDGTVSGGVTISDGAMVSGGSGCITTSLKLDSNSDYTFSAFIKKIGNATSDAGGIIATTSNNNIWFRVRNDGAVNVYYYDGSLKTLSSSAGLIVNDIEYHLLVVFNKSNGTISLYVDNVLINSVEDVTILIDDSVNVGLFRQAIDNDRIFNGSISTAQIFNRVLTEEERTAIYNAGKDAQSPIQDGLVGQWSGKRF